MNYREVEAYCKEQNRISRPLIEQELIPLAGKLYDFETRFKNALKRHAQLIKQLPEGFESWLLAQHMSWQLFSTEGVGTELTAHRKLENIADEAKEWLQQQAETPWRHCFCEVVSQEEETFYTMRDLLTGDEFPLHSGGVGHIITELDDESPLFFLLIGKCGDVWQTYGMLSYLCNFSEDDLFSFAEAIDPSIEVGADIARLIEENPLPFMLLYSFAEAPLMRDDEGEEQADLLVQCPLSALPSGIEEHFQLDSEGAVTRLRAKDLLTAAQEPECYFDKEKQRLWANAHSHRNYDKLELLFAACGIALPEDYDAYHSALARAAIRTILKVEPVIEPYKALFRKQESAEDAAQVKAVRACVALLRKCRSEQITVPLDDVADRFGLPLATVQELDEMVVEMLAQ